MTDGILLTEIQQDRFLNQYDTIIIDEAHERSLNIDFILGYLRQLLPKRPDLKVIITSATIDPERFSEHFNNAPIISVSGRTYPLKCDIDLDELPEGEQDQIQGIIHAVEELSPVGSGDILVFLGGEREIRDTAEALNKQHWRHTEVVPLYARLSASEQNRIFQSHSGRRIVLSTNVAETSLTVPEFAMSLIRGWRVFHDIVPAVKYNACRLRQSLKRQHPRGVVVVGAWPRCLYSIILRTRLYIAPRIHRSGNIENQSCVGYFTNVSTEVR